MPRGVPKNKEKKLEDTNQTDEVMTQTENLKMFEQKLLEVVDGLAQDMRALSAKVDKIATEPSYSVNVPVNPMSTSSYQTPMTHNLQTPPVLPTNIYPVPIEYRRIVDELLSPEFGVEIEPSMDSPHFMFSVVVPLQYSNIIVYLSN